MLFPKVSEIKEVAHDILGWELLIDRYSIKLRRSSDEEFYLLEDGHDLVSQLRIGWSNYKREKKLSDPEVVEIVNHYPWLKWS